MPESLAQAGAVDSFGAVPLIVLSRGVERSGAGVAAAADRPAPIVIRQPAAVRRESGHNIQLEQPEAAVGAIVQMVEQIRRQPLQ